MVGFFVVVVLGGLKLTLVIEPLGATTLILRGPIKAGRCGIGVGPKFVKFWQGGLVLAVGVV